MPYLGSTGMRVSPSRCTSSVRSTAPTSSAISPSGVSVIQIRPSSSWVISDLPTELA